ncbi:hypothetical protein ULG90_10705 [Halopseudomonas pachastrellae]|nr:hypothetical protein ULG90_10705 [Halopseudomonas pachastrellae]
MTEGTTASDNDDVTDDAPIEGEDEGQDASEPAPEPARQAMLGCVWAIRRRCAACRASG